VSGRSVRPPRRERPTVPLLAWLMTLLALALPLRRAAAEQEAQLWLELDLGHRLSRRWELRFEQHLRWDEDMQRLAQVMPDLSASYRARSFLRVTAGYRLQYERDGSGDFELRHRFYTGAQVQRDLGDVRLSLRALFTEQLRPDDSGNDARRAGLRTRGGASWRGPKRWKATATAELFLDLEAPELTKLRLGLDLQPGLRHFEVGYRLELPRDDSPTEHALVLSSAFEL
jgi:Protein of unknown function (DUF2490)